MKPTLLLWPKQFFFPLSPRIREGWLKYDTQHFVPMRYEQCKLGSNLSVHKGTLFLRANHFFRPYLHSHYTGVTGICDVALPAHALPAVQDRLILVSKELHFTPEGQTRPNLPSQSSGVT
jgi:hypothetical protein